jgi:hypothetical protein
VKNIQTFSLFSPSIKLTKLVNEIFANKILIKLSEIFDNKILAKGSFVSQAYE